MAELLLELFSEEIPARMQVRAADDLMRLVTARLKAAGLTWDKAEAHSTPRRLTLVIDGLPTAQPDISEDRRGPRADAPEKAIEGFLKSAGLTRDQLEEREEKKGTFLYAVIERKGGATADVLGAMVPDVIANMPWPKSQRWGDGSLTWVRPLQRILCLFDGKVVPAEIGGLVSADLTEGHRFLAPGPFAVTDFADYKAKLEAAYVILDREERARRIEDGALKLAQAQGLDLIEDKALLEEVTGLVEWPVPLMGRFDEAFLGVPEEVLTATMRGNQKYFSLRDPQKGKKAGKLAPRFIVVANMETADNGAAIVAGNERVLAARLSDARFFWDQDRKVPLESRVPALDGIVFHEKLGSVGDKVTRLIGLSFFIAGHLGEVPDSVIEPAKLAKADLLSGMVGEFPELQGVMGSYYAKNDGKSDDVVAAIREHYSPLGPSDTCPSRILSVIIALADKLDTLCAFYSIGEKPTGSRDPFALRRAALGVARLIIENKLRINLHEILGVALAKQPRFKNIEPGWSQKNEIPTEVQVAHLVSEDVLRDVLYELMNFFADRLKVQQREKGVRHDLIDAVFSLGGEDDLVRLLARVDALSKFLATDDGANLLAGFKRASNIVRIEERKDKASYRGEADPSLLKELDEKALYNQLKATGDEARAKAAAEDFEGAMAAMATLRAPVDAFFDNVTVNCDDAALRKNRLLLLSQFGAALGAVADFSKIEG